VGKGGDLCCICMNAGCGCWGGGGGNWTANGPGVTGPPNDETDPAGEENAGVGGVWAGRGTFIERLGARFEFFEGGRFVVEREGEVVTGGCRWAERSIDDE